MDIKKKYTTFKKKINQLKQDKIINKYYNLKINEKIIFFQSKNGKDVASNIFYLIGELSKDRYNEYELILAIKKELISDKREFFKNYRIFNLKFVEVGTKDYYRYLYTAKYLFCDSTLPYFYKKKENQIYINTWHGTPLKKLGKSNFKRGYALANVQKNFAMADYLIYPNDFMEEMMLNSFMIRNIFSGKIINEGYPRNTIFFNKDAAKKLKSELNLNDKEIIAYLPTWRGLYNKLNIFEQNNDIKNYLSEIDQKLSDDQIFFVKLHTVVDDQIEYDRYKHIRSFPIGIETYDFLNITNCLITDYSSVFFDYACSNKKIILFPYDYQEYIEDVGIYFDLNDLPFPKVYNSIDLISEINKNKDYDDYKFVEKFCKYNRSDSTKRICEYIIFNQLNDIKVKNIDSNNKENVLIYAGSLSNNKITKRLFELIKNIDLSKRNYYLTFKASKVKNNPENLYEISKFVDYIPMNNSLTLTLKDKIIFKFFFKYNLNNNFINKQIKKCFKRNREKYFQMNDFTYAIDFIGSNNDIINLFQTFEGNKTLFVQKNMVDEINNGRIHKNTLKNAYNYYDNVFIVDKDYLKSKNSITFNNDNLILCESDNIEEIKEKFESIFT